MHEINYPQNKQTGLSIEKKDKNAHRQKAKYKLESDTTTENTGRTCA